MAAQRIRLFSQVFPWFLVAGGLVVSFAADPIYVFLLAGQSNMSGMANTNGLPAELKVKQERVLIHVDPTMDGAASRKGTWMTLEPGFGYGNTQFGPELAFAAKLITHYPDIHIALIKSAVAGTDLDKQWRPPSSGGTVGKLYANFIKEIKDAMGSLEGRNNARISGMLWMQGEADAMNSSMTTNYQTNFENIIADIRKEVGVDSLPFVAANIDEQAIWTNYQKVNGAMNTVAGKMDNVITFPTKGFNTDGIHYQTQGMIDLGEAFASAIIEGKYLENKVAIISHHSVVPVVKLPSGSTRNAVIMYNPSGRKIPNSSLYGSANNFFIKMYMNGQHRSYKGCAVLSSERNYHCNN